MESTIEITMHISVSADDLPIITAAVKDGRLNFPSTQDAIQHLANTGLRREVAALNGKPISAYSKSAS